MKNRKHKEGETATSDAARGLRELLVEELKDIYWAEKALTRALPKMIKNADSEKLVDVLTEHSESTAEQVTRLEEVFSYLNERATTKKCEAMAGLIKEAEEIMLETEKGPVRDAAIILAAQKIEHYEIATYGTLCAFAKTLEKHDVFDILENSLEEEKAVDKRLTELAEVSINLEATDENQEYDEDTMVDVKSKRKQVAW